MQQLVPRIAKSACPHDCPSTCALEVPVLADGRIGRISGARDNSYTQGVVCAKVAKYAERIEHPDRLLAPLRRTGPKGSSQFEPVSWAAALAEIAERFTRIAQRSIAKERAPCVRIHPDAAAREGVSEGCRVRIGNHRGSVLLTATLDAVKQATTLIVEGIWPADAFDEKRAINTLIGDDPVPPNGGAGFHDTDVWLQRA
jgi:anaerobic selenocysteine-containing dehydrogenase